MNNHDIMKSILPQTFMLQQDVIKLIPDAKPRNTIRFLDQLLYANVMEELLLNHTDSSAIDALNFDLLESEAEWSRVNYWEEASERTVLTTVGANLLIRLFKAGYIEQTKKNIFNRY